jgi:hypothetical protein
MGAPARGYSWPPFESGNTAAVRHGAFSTRFVDATAEELRPHLLEVAPWLDHPAFGAAVDAWIRSEARIALLAEHAERIGLIDDRGEPRESLLKWLHAAERLAAEHRARLGLDPTSRVRLERDRSTAALNAVDVASELERGRQLRLAAELRHPPQLEEGADPGLQGDEAKEGEDHCVHRDADLVEHPASEAKTATLPSSSGRRDGRRARERP